MEEAEWRLLSAMARRFYLEDASKTELAEEFSMSRFRVARMLGGFVNGLLITFLPALLLEVLGDFGEANTTFGDTDFGWVGIATGYPARLGSAGIVVIALVGAAILGAAIVWQKRKVDTGWDPAPHRERPGAADSGATPATPVGSTSGAASYARIPPPAGAPAPPPPPAG